MRRIVLSTLLILVSEFIFSQAWMQYLPATKSEKELTFYDYQDAFKEWCRVKEINNEGYYYDNGEKRKAYGWKQFKRWEIQMEGWYDRSSGRFYDIDIWKAFEEHGLLNRGLTDDAGLGNWVSLAYGEEGNGNDGNGRINCMAFHPTNQNKYWIGAAWGGLWETENNGNTWAPKSDLIGQTAIGAIAIPDDYDVSQTIYLGTGDRGYFDVRGVGILKSTDGGTTWQNTSLSYQNPEELSVGRILIQPSDQNVLFAATSDGIYKSTDAGETWTRKKIIIGKDMEFHPSHDSIIYASTRLDYSTDKVYIYRSHDRGNNWAKVFEVTGIRIELAVSPNNPNLVYAVVSNHDGALQGFYKSVDSGLTFQLQFDGYNILGGDCTGADPGGQGGYDLCITVNPQNAQHVFIGGINVWKSLDGGSNWTIVNDSYWNCGGVNGNVHVDQHWLDYQPNTNKLFVLNDGGIYHSTNHGVSWVNISGGLVINQPYRISNSQQVYNKIIMGQQDNGTVLWENNTIDFVGGGDGTDCLINPLDHNHQIKTANSPNVWYTLNNWATYHTFPAISDPYRSWFKPIVILPMDTIYYGVSNIWKSTNKGMDFTKICEVPEHDSIPLKRIAIAPSNHQVAYFHNIINLYKTTNDFSTFSNITANLPAGYNPWKIYQIAIKETDPNTLWITNTEWNDGYSVLKSSDGGGTWEDISAGLPDAPWYDIIHNKLQSDYEELYVCGYLGVYVRLGYANWVPFMDGLPNVISFDMDIYYDGIDSKLRNGTHGRGVWESGLFASEPGASRNWTGVYNTSWHDYRNWEFLTVPDGTQDIVIPAGTPYSPAVFSDQAICKSIIINPGAQLSITGKVLTLVDSLVINGTLRMTAPGSELEVDGLINWKSGSNFIATTSLNNKIRAYGNWIFGTGANNIKIDSADVYFMGNSNNTINTKAPGCGFGNLFIAKSPAKSTIFDLQSTEGLKVSKNLSIISNAKMTHNSTEILEVFGNIIADGDLFFQNGTCQLRGNDADIHLGNTGSYFNDLEVWAYTGKVKSMSSDILLRGNLSLYTGLMSLAGYNLKLTGDLVRYAGNLSQGSGRLTFRGSSKQNIFGTFIIHTVELAKPADTLFIEDDATFCHVYDWTEGTLAVTGTGSFIAFDLADDGILGSYYLKNNGSIDLTQDEGQYIDLNGIIRIEGGDFLVYGGKSDSYWAADMDCEIHMSGGKLDIKDQGIYLMPTYSLLENITGGVIRSAKSFVSFRNDFNPSGGLIELYGAGAAFLSHGTGGSFWDVKIIKTGTVSAAQNLTLNNTMNIVAGTFDLNGKTVNISSNLDISGGLRMTSPSSLLNVFGDVKWRIGSVSEISDGIITFGKDWYFNTGTSAQLTGNNTVKATSVATNQYVYHNDSDACFANFSLEKPFVTIQRHLILDNSSDFPMRVNGNLTLLSNNSLRIDSAEMIISGNVQANSSSFMRVYETGSITAGSASIDGLLNLFGGAFTANSATINYGLVMNGNANTDLSNLTLNGTIDIDDGSLIVHNNFSQSSTGHLILDGGSFIIDKPYTGSMFGFAGITDLNGGIFEISYEGIQFGTGATVNFNGGDMRIGGHFRAVQANSFQPTAGIVELINTIGSNIEVNNGNYFHELIINKTGTNPSFLVYPLTVSNNLVIERGEFYTSNMTLNVGTDLRIKSLGRLSGGSAEIYVGRDWTNERGTYGFIEGTSSVWLVSSQSAVMNSETFYNLDLDKDLVAGQYLSMTNGSVIDVSNKLTLNDGALLMSNNSIITIKGDLHIKDGGGLNANAAATGTTINCYGHWWDYNSLTDADHGFTCGQSTVNFKGVDEQELVALGGATFYKLNLQKTSGALMPSNSVTVLDDFNLQTGRWFYNATSLTHVFKGNFNYFPGANWMDDQNSVSFEGTQAQTLLNSGQGWLNFGILQVNRPEGMRESGSLNIQSNISCSKYLKIFSGNVTLDNFSLICEDSLVILNDGVLNLDNNVILGMGDAACIFINGGTLNLSGDLTNQPRVTRNSTGNYQFLVDNGGTIQASFTIFEYMNDRGLDIQETGLIGGTFPFYHCTFRNGPPSSYLILMNNDLDVTLFNVDFPSDAGSDAKNVAKSHNTGNIYLPDATGVFAGPEFEYDPNSRIHWPSTGIWDGDVSTEWHNAQNWRYDYQYPDAGTDVIIPSGAPNYPEFSVQETTVKSLTLEPGTSLTIDKDSLTVLSVTNIRGLLNMPEDYTALFTDSLVWQAGSSANLASRATIYISGNMFIRHGSDLDLGLGEIKYYGDGESKLICHDTAQIFSLLNYKNAPYSLSLAGDTLALLTVNGAFTNGPGATLKCPSSQEWTFNGNFRNTQNGHFRCENGSIRLRGSITPAYFRLKQGDYFNNLTIETPTRVNLYYTAGYSDTLRVNGNLVINSRSGGTSGIQANNFKIILRGDWINDAGSSAFSGGNSNVIFSNLPNPQIISGNTIFYNVDAGAYNNGSLSFYGNNTVSNMLLISFPVYVNGNLNASVVNIDDSGPEIHLMDGCYMQIGTLIQGGLIHCQGGTLNVLDMNEDFVFGNYLIDGGLVILGQSEGNTTHDLYGDYTINGGELRFTGGNGSSSWPGPLGGGYASLTMTGGLFYLQNHGVEIRNNSFTENISGGTIRVNHGFYCTAGVTTFSPTGGAVEIVTPDDAGVAIIHPDSHFWDLIINNGDYGGATYPSSNFKVKNELKIMSGTFHIVGFEITVGP